jgi:hypothetical protein
VVRPARPVRSRPKEKPPKGDETAALWLGHRDINITYAIYSHFMRDAEDRAINVLDAEYAEWSAA